MDKLPQVEFTCLACGAKFPAPQGSKRYYCDKCLVERVQAGKKIDGKVG